MLHGYFPSSFSKKKKGMQLQFLWEECAKVGNVELASHFPKCLSKDHSLLYSGLHPPVDSFLEQVLWWERGVWQIRPAETRRFSALLMALFPEAADSPDCTLKTAGGFREHSWCPSLIPTSGTHCFRLHLAIGFISKHHLIIPLFIMVKNHSQKLRATVMEKSIQLRFGHIFIRSQDNLVSTLEESNA